MERSPDTLSPRTLYKLMTGSIVPRPIGWISTLSEAGTPNLAPFSYFNAVSAAPPTLLFCLGMKDPGTPKDTLKNVRSTGEFVVNIVTEALAKAMNHTSIKAPYGEDEFALAGVTPSPSLTVEPPRVAESPVHFECRVAHIYPVGEDESGSHIVVGRITHIHVDDDVLIDGDKIDIAKLKPVGRLAGRGYARITDTFELERPVYEDKKD